MKSARDIKTENQDLAENYIIVVFLIIKRTLITIYQNQALNRMKVCILLEKTLQKKRKHQKISKIRLIEEQNKVFAYGYTIGDLKELKKTEHWFSLAAIKGEKIIGNIVVVIKED